MKSGRKVLQDTKLQQMFVDAREKKGAAYGDGQDKKAGAGVMQYGRCKKGTRS